MVTLKTSYGCRQLGCESAQSFALSCKTSAERVDTSDTRTKLHETLSAAMRGAHEVAKNVHEMHLHDSGDRTSQKIQD